MVWALLAVSEAITASKQPQRSNLTSDLKSVTPITYLSMCILLIWYLPVLAASEATTASKQPQRSVRLSQESSLTYVNMFQDTQVATMSPISLVHKIFPGGKMTLTTPHCCKRPVDNQQLAYDSFLHFYSHALCL